MSLLALSIIAGVVFLQLLRTGQQRRSDQMLLIWANYAVAAAFSYVLVAVAGTEIGRIDKALLVAGVCNGTLYVAHLLLVAATIRLAGTGVTSAVMAGGAIGGVLMAWVLFGESLSAWQWGAVATMPFSLLLMRNPSAFRFRHSLRTDGVLLANFLMIGVIATIHKTVSFRDNQGRAVYQLVIFSAAFFLTTVVVLRNRRRPSPTDILLGAAAGIANVASTLFLLSALNVLLAAVVFPTRSSLSVLLSLSLGWMLWRESPSRRQLVGAALAIVTVILANLH
jgi:drug/metabolite transporter (DMT)-like permease